MYCPDICGWSALACEFAHFPVLKGELRADYVVIGGGFTGLSAARRLAEEKPQTRIILIDAKRIAGGASARNSGFAVANESPGHAQLHTPAGLTTYMTKNRIDHAGMAELRRLVEECQISCQWEDTGSIHAAHDPKNFNKLRDHAKAFGDLGVDARLIEGADLAKRLGTSFYELGVEARGGALLQPAMLAQGLAASLPETIECYEDSPVQNISRAGDGWKVQLTRGSLTAPHVIVAVNAFFPRLGLKRLQVFPLVLTASLTRQLTAAEEDEIGHAKTWGILSPQSLGATMRLTKDRRILLRNTVEYRPSGIDGTLLAARRKVHADGLKKRFPFLDESAIEYSWSGNICISRNSQPVFEQSQPGLYLCGGYNAAGVSRGTIMGRLIADLALGGQSELLSDALNLIKPNLIPPRPFFDIGARLRLSGERKAAQSES
ncbi:MAG: FAD-binding oxidoreductase [Devosiaceae bacterium]|nr:FAD-binding oxidoreductase [Devosiaceae bacterium]